MAPATFTDVLAGNVRAQRSRKGLGQASVVARMRALGYTSWHRQTMGKVERAERRLTAEEIYGLAWALETSVGALMRPTDDDKHVEFPSGASLAAVSVQRSVGGGNDGAVRWSRDEPVFPGPAMTHAESRTWLDGLGADDRAQFEEIRSAVHAQEEQQAQPVVAAIVTSPLGVLVGRRRDGRPPWTFIAGEQDAVQDESPEDTAVREVKEETGLLVRAGEVIGERVHPKTSRTMIYIAAVPTHGTDVFVGDEEELAEVRWVSLTEADELLPGMFEPVREHLAREIDEAQR